MSNIEIRNVLVEDAKVGLTYNMSKTSLGVNIDCNQDGLYWTEFINIYDLPDLLWILDVPYIEDIIGKPIRMKSEFALGAVPKCKAIGHIVKDEWWERPESYPDGLFDSFNEYLGVRK